MARFFNTTGPCNPEDHYFLAPDQRLRGANLHRYIDQKMYWVLHAARQTGKTTFLQTWMREINASGQAIACYVSVEACQGVPEVDRAMPTICAYIRSFAKDFDVAIPDAPSKEVPPEQMLGQTVKQWAELCAPLPLVVLFDEVDTLEGPAMISFLRQLRGGFASRGVGRFPVSVALVGMRDLRDYLTHSKDGVPTNPGSPFNIKQDSATLSNFSRDDVVALLGQHTAESGQAFEPDAVEAIWYWTQGQPYLVNKLADICVERLTDRDPAKPITGDLVLEAKELLIQARTTHLDALAERLKQAEVKKVVQTILVGDSDPAMAQERGFELCLDLGLVTLDKGVPSIANPLYREVLPRALNYGMQIAVPYPEFRWQTADGKLDMDALLREFQSFWAEHADLWEAKADYTEAFPHLLLMAFFQRVLTTEGRDAGGGAAAKPQPEGARPGMGSANGGGRITREYAAGRGRVDLLVEYVGQGHIVEIKLVRTTKGRDKTIEEALLQVDRYRDTVGDRDTPTYVVLFDRTEGGRKLSWEQRLTWTRHETPGGMVTVVGG